MDDRRFDDLTKTLSSTPSRRGIIRLLTGVLGGFGASVPATGPYPDASAAARRKKQRRARDKHDDRDGRGRSRSDAALGAEAKKKKKKKKKKKGQSALAAFRAEYCPNCNFKCGAVGATVFCELLAKRVPGADIGCGILANELCPYMCEELCGDVPDACGNICLSPCWPCNAQSGRCDKTRDCPKCTRCDPTALQAEPKFCKSIARDLCPDRCTICNPASEVCTDKCTGCATCRREEPNAFTCVPTLNTTCNTCQICIVSGVADEAGRVHGDCEEDPLRCQGEGECKTCNPNSGCEDDDRKCGSGDPDDCRVCLNGRCGLRSCEASCESCTDSGRCERDESLPGCRTCDPPCEGCLVCLDGVCGTGTCPNPCEVCNPENGRCQGCDEESEACCGVECCDTATEDCCGDRCCNTANQVCCTWAGHNQCAARSEGCLPPGVWVGEITFEAKRVLAGFDDCPEKPDDPGLCIRYLKAGDTFPSLMAEADDEGATIAQGSKFEGRLDGHTVQASMDLHGFFGISCSTPPPPPRTLTAWGYAEPFESEARPLDIHPCTYPGCGLWGGDTYELNLVSTYHFGLPVQTRITCPNWGEGTWIEGTEAAPFGIVNLGRPVEEDGRWVLRGNGNINRIPEWNRHPELVSVTLDWDLELVTQEPCAADHECPPCQRCNPLTQTCKPCNACHPCDEGTGRCGAFRCDNEACSCPAGEVCDFLTQQCIAA